MEKGYTGADRALKYLFEHATETEVEQTLTSGTKIAEVTIDGQSMELYAPASKGITVTGGKVSLT